MKNLTIQALINSQWLDIAELQIMQPEKGAASLSELGYNLNYAIKHLDKRDECACSLSLPINILVKHESKKWFGFLDADFHHGVSPRGRRGDAIGCVHSHFNRHVLFHFGRFAHRGLVSKNQFVGQNHLGVFGRLDRGHRWCAVLFFQP